MTKVPRILAARALLEDVTPLKGDCGRKCGGACCKPDDEGRGGMLLFPGEETLYADEAWHMIKDSGLRLGDRKLYFFTCDGTCDRAMRPLACRIFPLTPVAHGDELRIELDVRAWPVCPLMGFGVDGMSREFVAAVRAAMTLLWEDEIGRAYIELLTGELEKFKSL